MNQTGTPATGSYGTIKYSANRQYKLTLPAGLQFYSVDFYGYANADGGSSYLSEVNGTTYDANVYSFPARNTTPGSITHSISFEEPFSDTFSFTPKGSQTCLLLTLHVSQPSGITDVRTKSMPLNDAIYSLDGRRVTSPKKGIYIIGGKKVVVN